VLNTMSTEDCTSVSPTCPVSATIYGYYPNLGGNSFFTAVFAVLLIAQLVIGVWKRTWSFTAWVSIACFLELLGYIGRLLMHANPWSVAGFEIQICCLVLAPTFLAAGIYLTVKHVVNFVGPEYSRLKPRLYPWIFISCDICSIVVQAVGGGVAASGGTSSQTSQSVVNAGDDLIVAGIAFQVFTMAICGSLALDFYVRMRKANQTPPAIDKSDDDALQRYGTNSKKDRQFHIYCGAMILAYFAILIRCIYRIPEMAGGWGNPRMREEATFLVLDGLMIAIAGTALTLAHPGIMFPTWTTTNASVETSPGEEK
jgi:hypothetical protein